ncbi:MAG: tRNA threonylcarbamoyladenosine dehydratase [Spirochaetales bacterium]|nr:tRNA threonylcarbamoyladenosine dehydratase [Candidatus Physcosoma equi]
MNQFIRSELVIGRENQKKLRESSVIIFGVGGVGGYVVEALARSCVGRIDLVDNDTFNETNINRQILATWKTVGRVKVEVAKERILDINPEALVNTYRMFYLPETRSQFDFSQYDYLIDCIDTVSAKLDLVEAAKKAGVPIISSMGAGNKMDPLSFTVTDIYKTDVDPLARVMRRECRKRGIKSLKVVYSTEEAMTPVEEIENEALAEEGKALDSRKRIPGSTPLVPSVAGLVVASEVVKDILSFDRNNRK